MTWERWFEADQLRGLDFNATLETLYQALAVKRLPEGEMLASTYYLISAYESEKASYDNAGVKMD